MQGRNTIVRGVNRSASLFLLAAAAASVCLTSRASAAEADATPADAAAGKKVAEMILGAKTPPFSFTYDGKPSAAWLASAKQQSEDKDLGNGRTQKTITWKDANGLSVRMVSVQYANGQALEWTVYLRNDGSADSKLIDNLRGIDATIAQAPAGTAKPARANWSGGRKFPTAASGEQLEFYRGWDGGWKPMAASNAEGKPRFATGGKEPWIAADSTNGALLMMPAAGVEAATDVETTGKSPATAFVAPADGVYHVAGSITKIGQGGDGIEWSLQNFAGYTFATGVNEDDKPMKIDQVAFLRKGEKIGLAMQSRATNEGDLSRVVFDVTQLTNVLDGDVVIHTNKGSEALETDYQTIDLGLGASDNIPLASRGGRPSDWTTLPYFNVQTPTGGSVVAIGWPGQWNANFTRESDNVRLAAGQETVHTVLHPGEEIRSPLIAVLPYAGTDSQHGQNLWRRWMVEHNMPRVDGKLRGPFIAACSSHQTAEMIKGNEQNQIGYIKGYIENGIKLDYWWMDAGWYMNEGNWVNTGTWKVDMNRFPNGLKGVTDFAHGKGINQILWFEPERVTRNSELGKEHQDFLLTAMQDYSNPSAGLFSMQMNTQSEPNVTFNPLDRPRYGGPLRWAPKQMTLHPGPNGEFSAVRFTAPAAGKYQVNAKFAASDPGATTDVHVLHGEKALFDNFINVNGRPAQEDYSGTIDAQQGDTIDFTLGRGNEKYEGDTTSLSVKITAPDGKTYEAGEDLKISDETHGVWSFGSLAAGAKPVASSFTAYPKQIVFGDSQDWKLLNLGNPKARQWITDRVDSIIKSQGINLYRQDFNISPLNYWKSADSADRQGMTENQYIQGYLHYWDDLRARNPGLLIDSCASGGRRNDLETMRRAVPLTRSDYLFVPIGMQTQTFGLCQWLPHHGTGVLVGKSTIFPDMTGKIDPYFFRSQMAPTIILCADTTDKSIDYETFRRMVNEFRDNAPNYYGDYYQLTPFSLAKDTWMAWQFDRPADGAGMVQVFRRDTATAAAQTFKLHGLDPKATYKVTDVEHPNDATQVSGEKLMGEGLEVKVAIQPGSTVIRYARE